MRLGYLVHSAFVGMARAWALTAMSLSTLAVGLWLLGLLTMVALSCRTLATAWTQEGHLTCAIGEDVSPEARDAVRARVAALPGVREVLLQTPEDNLQALQTLGSHLSEGVEAAWLPASLRIAPDAHVVQGDEMGELAARIARVPHVLDVDFGAAPLLQVHRAAQGITLVVVACGIALVLALTFMVNNTIRLMLFNRQDELRILKLIGATDAFVQAPFVIEGLVWGVLAGVAAACGGVIFEHAVFAHLERLGEALSMPTPHLMMPPLFVFEMALGGLIGLIGSTLASRAFLRDAQGLSH